MFPILAKDRALRRQRSNWPRGIPTSFDPWEWKHYFSWNFGRLPPTTQHHIRQRRNPENCTVLR